MTRRFRTLRTTARILKATTGFPRIRARTTCCISSMATIYTCASRFITPTTNASARRSKSGKLRKSIHRSRRREDRGSSLVAAEPDEGDAKANDQHPEPALPSDFLAQEERRTNRPGRITERGHGHDKTDIFHGKRGEQGKERHGHQANADPHPSEADGAPRELQKGGGAKIMNLAQRFHGARDAQFSAGSGRHDQG